MTIAARVVRNTASNAAGKTLALAAGLLLTPFILGRLQPTEYGMWTLVVSVVGYGSLLDFGIAGAVTKYVAEYRARHQIDRAADAVLAALSLYVVLGVLAAALCIVLAPQFPRFFHVPAAEQTKAVKLVVLMGLGVGISIPAATTTAVLCGLQRFDVASFFSSMTAILSTCGTALTLYLGGGLLEMVSATILISTFMQLPTIWYIARIEPGLRLRGRRPQPADMRKLIAFSWSIFVLQVSWRLQTRTDEMVIAAWLPISSVTPYALARKLSESAQVLTQQFLKVLSPLASQLDAENDSERLRAVYVTGTRLSLAIFLPAGLVLILFAGPILSAWIGPSYARYSNIVVILALAGLLDTVCWPAGAVLQGIARHHGVALNSSFTALANLGLSIFLVTRYGVVGVAVGTLIPTALSAIAYVVPYTVRVMKVPGGQVWNEMLVPAFIPVVPAAVVAFVLRLAVAPSTVVGLLTMAACCGITYCATYAFVAAPARERQAYRAIGSDLLRAASTHFDRSRTWFSCVSKDPALSRSEDE